MLPAQEYSHDQSSLSLSITMGSNPGDAGEMRFGEEEG